MIRPRERGNQLVESMAGLFIFIPLILFATDVAVMFHAAHANEEFAEQLARLCSTVPNQANALRACQDVIRQYQLPPGVTDLNMYNLKFDVGKQEVSLTTAMDIKMPIPFPGYSQVTVTANAAQPIVSIPAAR